MKNRLQFSDRIPMVALGTCVLLCVFVRRPVRAEERQQIDGRSVCRAEFSGSDIVITTTNRLAGAIHSLTWKGQEFINSADHGRQLQSAANFDCGSKFTGETFNPTEAGSRQDGAGTRSSSRLLHLICEKNRLQTTSQMAFWLRPGQRSGGHLAKNTTVLSNHLLTKRVTIGWKEIPNAIHYDVSFSVPIGEHHTYAQFEAVTGYMPPVFEVFQTYDYATDSLAAISDGPGEQKLPLVFSTQSGGHAMGIYSPDLPSSGYANAGYGRWNFRAQKVVKWNCVFRERNAKGIPAGDYRYQSFVAVGTLADVKSTLRKLHQQFLK